MPRDQSLPPRLTSDEARHHLAGRRPPRCLCPWVRHATRLGSDLRGDSFGTSSSTATSAGAEPTSTGLRDETAKSGVLGLPPSRRGSRQHEETASQAASPRDRNSQRSSTSRPVEASTVGLTATRTPDRTHPRWLGAKRGANSPSLISRVTAKRLNTVGGRRAAHCPRNRPTACRYRLPRRK